MQQAIHRRKLLPTYVYLGLGSILLLAIVGGLIGEFLPLIIASSARNESVLPTGK
jgi:hypothetical protein